MTDQLLGRRHNVQLRYGHDVIAVAVRRRAGDRLSLTVETDGSVNAVAPITAAPGDVRHAIERRLPWIAKQRRFFEQFKPLLPDPQYVSGETILYLGRQYRLKVNKQVQDSVRLIGRYLQVGTATPSDAEGVQRIVKQWYRLRAETVLRRQVHEADRIVKLLSLQPPTLTIRSMLRRWGSCTPRGRITLNEHLVKVAVPCIDYVVAHELCHLKVLHHGHAFERLMNRVMPDWRKRKARLDRFVLPND